MKRHSEVTNIGIQREVTHTRIKCGCGAKTREDVVLNHGTDRNGALLPCPRPKAIEHLGTAEDRDKLIYDAGCTTWDEYASKHPVRAWIFLKRNQWKDRIDESLYSHP